MNPPDQIQLSVLAEITDSTIQGDDQLIISNVATLQKATKGEISFVSNPKYKKQLETTKASVVILSPKLASDYNGTALVNSDPYLTFAKVVNAFHKPEKAKAFLHPSAVIASDSIIGERVFIGANVVISSGVTIGSDSVIKAGTVIGKNTIISSNALIHANVTIYNDIKIGKSCIIHSGVVIGSDGFGFAPKEDKSWYKILQIGDVVIGDNVEIGANTTIDRGALGSTTIKDGVKLDNQIQIAHNVEIGCNTVLAGATGVAGSSIIGERCQIGGAVAISGHLTITDDVMITGRSMVTNSLKTSGVYSSGIAIEENRKWRRNAARFRHLDEMAKKLKELEKKLEIALENKEK